LPQAEFSVPFSHQGTRLKAFSIKYLLFPGPLLSQHCLCVVAIFRLSFLCDQVLVLGSLTSKFFSAVCSLCLEGKGNLFLFLVGDEREAKVTCYCHLFFCLVSSVVTKVPAVGS